MNTIDELKRRLRTLGIVYRNLYAEFPQFVILGKKESSLCEQEYLSTLKPSELAKNTSLQKDILGFKIIRSTEPQYFAVANTLMTEEQFLALNDVEIQGADLFNGDNKNMFLGLPLERIPTTNGLMYGIVLHNTDKNPTLDTYSELNQAYEHFNKHLFGGELPACLITFQREKKTKGYVSKHRFVNKSGEMIDELAMNPSYFGVRSIIATLSTLVHEMCHLWQHHYGSPSRAGYHNKEWAEKMEKVGLIPTDTGSIEGKKVGQKISHCIHPEGQFIKVCKDLISNDFALSWCDRFPPMPEEEADDFDKSIIPLTDGSDEKNPIPKDPFFEPSVDPVHLTFDEREKEQGKLPNTGKSNRIKYRCPLCENQCWGKPNLLLKCGEPDCDNEPFIES